MTLPQNAALTAVILANRCRDGVPLAGQRVCGVPLVRRHLQVVGAIGWRKAVIVVPPARRQAIEEAVGNPVALGVHVSYLEVDEEVFPAHLLFHLDTAWLLVLEGHYVIEGALLTMLKASGANAMLCDSRSREGHPLTLKVQNEHVVVCGERTDRPTHAYAGAVLLSREALLHLGALRLGSAAHLTHLVALKAVDVHSSDLYIAEIRRQAAPFWCAVEAPADAEFCKRALITGAQKHILDAVAWYVNRPLENALTLRIADWPITPNQVTLSAAALGFVVTGLLLAGCWLPALLLAFVVSVLDGVDGKLARVKALASRLGQLEHSFDLLYEQSWYIAFAWATYMQRRELLVLVVGFFMLWWDSFARHVSMQFRQAVGVSLSDYAPFDRAFRRWDGRRNTYMLYMLLGAITRQPFYALCAMALHALLTGVVYAVRAAKHLRDADRGFVNVL
jgi:phosphatidylglycerophosphate synthase